MCKSGARARRCRYLATDTPATAALDTCAAAPGGGGAHAPPSGPTVTLGWASGSGEPVQHRFGSRVGAVPYGLSAGVAAQRGPPVLSRIDRAGPGRRRSGVVWPYPR